MTNEFVSSEPFVVGIGRDDVNAYSTVRVHGELIVVYVAVMVTLFLAGGGEYSIDGQFLTK